MSIIASFPAHRSGSPKGWASPSAPALLVSWGPVSTPLAYVLIAGLRSSLATLESVFAICPGCIVFNRLMRWG